MGQIVHCLQAFEGQDMHRGPHGPSKTFPVQRLMRWRKPWLSLCTASRSAFRKGMIRAAEQARQHQGHHKSSNVLLCSRYDSVGARPAGSNFTSMHEWMATHKATGREEQLPALEPPFDVSDPLRLLANFCFLQAFGETSGYKSSLKDARRFHQ